MELSPLTDLDIDFPFPQTLGDEEEAWYRHDSEFDSVLMVKACLRGHPPICSNSGNPLEDDEDAWTRW